VELLLLTPSIQNFNILGLKFRDWIFYKFFFKI
jgi:hypothetical protein